MTRKIDHVGIMVKDINASIRFYTEVAGLKVKERSEHAGGLEVAFLGYGLEDETVIEMIQGLKDQLPSEGKIHHVAFSVDNIEDEWNRIKQLGVAFINEEIASMPSGIRYFFIYGPEEEWIEFFQKA
ncbi:lactoylglutathione lyase [Paenibacillus endophyticus]|uniref:Lactoylglutathione lyase n=1 Tax=Paenibacillus endophyticus TaxID=1294268 RepID=A0A7W5C2G5_9BACL|nr:VOC family protein [Paenibacillus endophyticus]MBB3150017.1 lactoylglutathione lyase [Paenibacillus endophyticus]